MRKQTMADQYNSLGEDKKESASSRPADEFKNAPHLTMDAEKEAKLVEYGFRRNKYRFPLGKGKYTQHIESGQGWIRYDNKGQHFYSNMQALKLLHEMESKKTT